MRLIPIIPILVLAAAVMVLAPRQADAVATTPASASLLGNAVSLAGQPTVKKAGVGFHLYIGPRHRYYRRHYYYRPYYYRRRYYRRRYHRRRYGRCGYWSKRCARNWGYGGKNYRGCLRYHGCR